MRMLENDFMVRDGELLEETVASLERWARARPFVRRLLVYGSRVRGTHSTDSDLDVAIEFDPVGLDSDCLTTWICDAKKWRKEIQPFIPWPLHLEWNDPGGETPHVAAGLGESSILVYERENLKV